MCLSKEGNWMGLDWQRTQVSIHTNWAEVLSERHFPCTWNSLLPPLLHRVGRPYDTEDSWQHQDSVLHHQDIYRNLAKVHSAQLVLDTLCISSYPLLLHSRNKCCGRVDNWLYSDSELHLGRKHMSLD